MYGSIIVYHLTKLIGMIAKYKRYCQRIFSLAPSNYVNMTL